MGRAAIIAEARAWVGTPYHHGASVKGVGCDCVGLVRGIWRAVVGPEPAEWRRIYDSRGHWTLQGDPLLAMLRRHFVERPAAEAEPGDLLTFKGLARLPVHHLTILVSADPGSSLGTGRVVHVPRGRPAVEVTYGEAMRRRTVAAFVFPGETAGGDA